MAERLGWKTVARRIRVPMGFVMAGMFLWVARPSWRTMLESLALVVPGLWLRGYASGYVKKNAELTVTGPYAHTRNPLYLGSMLIAFGFAVASAQWGVGIALGILFLAIYLPVIKGEEEYLRAHFSGFEEYARAVPPLLPRLTPARLSPEPAGFSAALYWGHREYNASMGAIAIYAVLAARLVFFSR